MKRIKTIEIKNSPFYNDCRIVLTEGLNCIMGGRGSGKTTLLYFIKSAIDPSAEDNDLVHKILKSNLGNGTINIEVEGERGTTFNITKTISELPQPYVFPGQVFVSIDKVLNDIECDIYEAGRIEEIGRSSKDRLELLDKKVKNEISEYETSIEKAQIDLDANAQDIKTLNRRIKQIHDSLTQFQKIEEEFESHKSQQPIGIKEDEKKEFETADIKEKKRKDEKQLFNKSIDLLKEFSVDIEFKKTEFLEFHSKNIRAEEQFENIEIMAEGTALLSSTADTIKSTLEKLFNEIVESRNRLGKLFSNLSEKHDQQQAEFVKLKQKFELNKEYINTYHELSKKVDEKKRLLLDIEELEEKQARLKEQRKRLIDKFNEIKQSIFNIRLRAVKELNSSFDRDIVITLTFGGITEDFQEKLRSALRGSGMRYNELIPRITANFSTDQFAKIIHEKDLEALKNIAGIDEVRSTSLIDALHETDSIYEIESLYCCDLPEFKLKIGEDSANIEDNYRKTDELSMGQRCTTVLPIIFAVSNNPLIIDQPEDNLDNKYITNRIHEIIRKQKESRQLIFITHNPNIPVLSDAEQNIFLLYENRKSKIEGEGTVDEVKDRIVSLLEGGEDAFRKRIEIYGFQN